jgi:hypothetical protein
MLVSIPLADEIDELELDEPVFVISRLFGLVNLLDIFSGCNTRKYYIKICVDLKVKNIIYRKNHKNTQKLKN